MKQLTQKLGSGRLSVEDVPTPIASSGTVLVRNHFSAISAGTEGSTVTVARKNLIAKAKERPQQARQVLDALVTQGPVQTYRTVKARLDGYSPLGYSTAGEVIEVGNEVTQFSIGDRVACAGAGYANHAEASCVPVNLCVKLPRDADLKRACYNTLGAIALQGIRQADLRLGETCVVIGLGLIGQLTCLMLRASGVRVLGTDVDAWTVDVASKHCCDKAWLRSSPGVADEIAQRTNGLGADTVIITAGTSSLDPINFAGEIARKRGRVVVVGAVPTGFDRDPHYYRKELELRMSCSYGPGRYDPNYEEKGHDYPDAYVRWTEKRNMEAFQELVYSNAINLDYLTTHVFPLEDVSTAYDLVVDRTEPFLGIVVQYDVERPLTPERISVTQTQPESNVGVAFIGAGNYAQAYLLPAVANDKRISCRGVMTNTGTTSKRVAERFGFEFCTSDPADIFDTEAINTVFIATHHDSHAEYVAKAHNI